ncbi:hypothetical protein SRHO_G00241840 [Serrasalmus rhombeus]
MMHAVERTRCIGCEEHRLVEKQGRCRFRLQCATHHGADIRLSPRMHCGEQHVVCNPRNGPAGAWGSAVAACCLHLITITPHTHSRTHSQSRLAGKHNVRGGY